MRERKTTWRMMTSKQIASRSLVLCGPFQHRFSRTRWLFWRGSHEEAAGWMSLVCLLQLVTFRFDPMSFAHPSPPIGPGEQFITVGHRQLSVVSLRHSLRTYWRLILRIGFVCLFFSKSNAIIQPRYIFQIIYLHSFSDQVAKYNFTTVRITGTKWLCFHFRKSFS